MTKRQRKKFTPLSHLALGYLLTVFAIAGVLVGNVWGKQHYQKQQLIAAGRQQKLQAYLQKSGTKQQLVRALDIGNNPNWRATVSGSLAVDTLVSVSTGKLARVLLAGEHYYLATTE